MSRTELVSPEGLRQDGRRPHELRNIKAQMGIFEATDGSAYFQQGNTRLLITVYGPREARHRQRADQCVINCDFSSLSGDRRKRKVDKTSSDISQMIENTFESVVQVKLFPKSQIDINILLLQADGGVRTASINGVCLALIDAGIPMVDFCCACSSGLVNSTPILDLNYLEESSGVADMQLSTLPQSGAINMLQVDNRLSLQEFEKVMNLAVEGTKKIHQILIAKVEEHTVNLLAKRGLVPS